MLKKLGFVNGCFDVLHIGHIRLFEFAKKHCDILVVGIDTDERVKELKGPDRPINNQDERAEFLMNLKNVDKVCFFSSDDGLTNLIKDTLPDIMIVGSDHRGKKVIGAEYAKELIFFERIKARYCFS